MITIINARFPIIRLYIIHFSIKLLKTQVELGRLVNYSAMLAYSLHTSQVAHQPGVHPDFCSMKRLGVFLLPPEWDASPLQGYPQHLPVPSYTPG